MTGESRDDDLAAVRAELARERAAHARTKKRLAQAERYAAAWERVARIVHAAAHPTVDDSSRDDH